MWHPRRAVREVGTDHLVEGVQGPAAQDLEIVADDLLVGVIGGDVGVRAAQRGGSRCRRRRGSLRAGRGRQDGGEQDGDEQEAGESGHAVE